jgi:hypothetical protein
MIFTNTNINSCLNSCCTNEMHYKRYIQHIQNIQDIQHIPNENMVISGGGGENSIYNTLKKEGFPYVKKFIKPDILFSKLVNYSKSMDKCGNNKVELSRNIATKGTNASNTKVMTFAIHDNQGLIHTHLRELLINGDSGGIGGGWEEVSINSAQADFAWVGATVGSNYLKYDKSIYDIKTTLKNLLVGGGVKGDTDNKDVITNKACLYKNMKKQFPNIYKKYMMKTHNVHIKNNELYDYKDGDVIIIRPIGAGGGADVYVVNNTSEYKKAISKLKRYKQVIATKYITNPLLLKCLSNKKFHLRMYLMVCVGEPYGTKGAFGTGFSWHFWNKGKIITSKLPYIPDDFTNPQIHDTHFKSTHINKYFPNDLNLEPATIKKLYSQMNEIMEASAKIIKNNAFSYPESLYAFEIFGVDMMITDDLVVKLIEINARHDYGVDDLKKENGDKHYKFCADFYDWIYKYAITPVFTKGTKGTKETEETEETEGANRATGGGRWL